MLGRIDLKEFMAWAEAWAKTHPREHEETVRKHTKKIGKLKWAYAFGCDRQNGGGGS